jgi:YHS domain-containing protein
MVQNLWWAAGYNILAIPLAAGILHNYGVVVSSAIGAIVMSLSTVIVALNSQTLRKYEPAVAEFKEKKYLSVDPVCGMKVKPEEAFSQIEYEDYVIHFCSKDCEAKFNQNPNKYLSKMKAEEPMKHEHHH